MDLSGNVLELGNPGEIMIIGVVDDTHGLILGDAWKVFMVEGQGTVRQLSETIAEIGVDGAGKDDVIRLEPVALLQVVNPQLNPDVRVIQHPLEHLCEAFGRHELVGVGEIAVIGVRAHRNPGCDPGAEIGRRHPPLFSGVAFEEFFIKINAN